MAFDGKLIRLNFSLMVIGGVLCGVQPLVAQSDAGSQATDGPAAAAKDKPATVVPAESSESNSKSAEKSDPAPKVAASFAPIAKAGQAADNVTDAAGQPANPANAAPKRKVAQKISFNFQHAPWIDVLKLFAETAGLTLDALDVPPGTFTYYDEKVYTPVEALDVLHGYLLQKGHVMIRRDRFLVVLNIDNRPIPPNLIPSVPLDELNNHGKNALLNVIMPLNGIDAEQASSEVQELLGPQGKVIALKTANSLSITDVSGNLIRIHKLLSSVIVEPDEELAFKSFPLERILAVEAERHIRNLFGLSDSALNVSASASTSRYYSSRYSSSSSSSRDPRYSRSSDSSRSGRPSTSSSKVGVTSDARTNNLLATGTPTELKVIEEVIKSIDIDINPAIQGIVSNNTPVFRVYKVNRSDPREVTKTLTSLIPGVVINEDGRNGFIHIKATPLEHREVGMHIRMMDGDGAQTVDIIRVGRFDPIAVAGVLNGVFVKDGDNAPTIQPESSTRSILVKGTPDQVVLIRKTLLGLGIDGTGDSADENKNRGPIRTIPLGGRDPAKFARMVEEIWSGSKRNQNEIRIVVPSEAGPVRDRKVPAASEPEAKPAPTPRTESRLERQRPLQVETQDDRAARGASKRRSSLLVVEVSVTKTIAQAGDDKPADDKPAEKRPAKDAATEPNNLADPPSKVDPAATQKPKSRITIRVSGGDLVVYSADEEALDRLEALIDELTQQFPVETTWTVFYLRSADATETAAMLEQLMPQITVSQSTTGAETSLLGGLTGGLSSFGSTLMDLTGLASLEGGPMSLRIIPELRSNSLFVSGPVNEVRDVERFLKILDASELPETLKDRVPRTIDVLYANVNQIADIVKEVYSDYMEDPNRNQRGRGSNPLALLMGGGGNRSGGGNSSRPTGIRLTLAVDSRTNQLIVSASDALFKQIEALVKSRDQAAFEAQRSFRLIALDDADSIIVQQALTSMLPKVSVSTTGSRSSSRNGNGAATNQTQQPGGISNQERAARIQQFLESRRQQQGGGRAGGTPGQPGGGAGRPGGNFGRGSGNFGRPSGGFDRSGGSSRGSSDRSRDGNRRP